MNIKNKIFVYFFCYHVCCNFFGYLIFALSAQGKTHHSVKVQIDPITHSLIGDDTITSTLSELEIETVPGLNLTGDDLVKLTTDSTGVERYRVKLQASTSQAKIHFSGTFPAAQDDLVIDRQGVNLLGGWYPHTRNEPYTYDLEVNPIKGMIAISQGAPVSVGENHWQMRHPQQSIVFLAGPYHEYKLQSHGYEFIVWLRSENSEDSEDVELAQRFLQISPKYLSDYEKMLGTYPYTKFILVENFLQTGFGLPAMTLLGNQVIRLPFILNSSYPHEILHNWWGNGVFVHYESGNWCEGLTTYLADHRLQGENLVQSSSEYRRTALNDYTQFAKGDLDFPLADFRARHSSSSQAVGYGKAMMVFHMLRQKIGDELFLEGLRKFYRDFLYKEASWQDIEVTFSQVSKTNLQDFFNQWINKKGAIELSAQLERRTLILTDRSKPGFSGVSVTVELTSATGEKKMKHIELFDGVGTLQIPPEVQLIKVDPNFDLFRKILPGEIPPVLARFMTETEVVQLTLPIENTTIWQQAFSEIAKQTNTVFIYTPGGTPISGLQWHAGWVNAPLIKAKAELYGISLSPNGMEYQGVKYPVDQYSIVLAFEDQAFWGTTDLSLLPILAQKLPHYGHFGLMVFEKAKNILRLSWPQVDSPLWKKPDNK